MEAGRACVPWQYLSVSTESRELYVSDQVAQFIQWRDFRTDWTVLHKVMFDVRWLPEAFSVSYTASVFCMYYVHIISFIVVATHL